jgi:hypothetical protein
MIVWRTHGVGMRRPYNAQTPTERQRTMTITQTMVPVLIAASLTRHA